MSEPKNLPVVPLREAVLFPGVTTPIAAGRPGTLRAIDTALADPERLVFVVAQRENVDEPTPDVLYTIGTIARIGQVQRGPSGMQLVLHGRQRGIAIRIHEDDNKLMASVRDAEEMPTLAPESPEFVALYKEAQELAGELGQRAGLPKEAVQRFLSEVDDPGRFADIVAAYTEMSTHERQALLETLSVEERIRRVLVLMQRQIGMIKAREDIKSKVREELGDRQREMFLREQLKAIKKELGEDAESDDVEELREQLDALELPEEVDTEVRRELDRLERMGPSSMESQVIRTYIDTILELPWNTRTEDHIDLPKANEVLEEDHYGLEDVKDRVLEYLAVRKLQQHRLEQLEESEDEETVASDGTPASEADEATAGTENKELRQRARRSPIMLFAGPPGVGKTSVAKSVARAMGREYVRISLGGVRDEADIRGHRRTYVGAMPGRIVQGMKRAGSKNPVFLLDEVDKLGVSYQGNPSAALLEVLDPAQNDTFTDHYLGVPFDLSEVLFIATANFLQNIPGPLLDRMEVVDFLGYTEREKLEIARRYLVPRQLEEAGLDTEQLTITDEAVSEVISRYTRESGVRQLEREIGRLARKVARKIAAETMESMELGASDVSELLGRPKVHPEEKATEDQIGVATGMFYTPTGGDIMFVEASRMPGKGELVLTGQLGDVMKESARAAWTFAKAHSEALRIEPDAFQQDVHVHVPAGAIPKDGPSAGVTMATALVSILSGHPIRHDVSMTGEITLSGRVLAIGGVKEKVLGAVRAGITSVVLPKANEADLEDLPEDIRNKLEIHLVEHLGEVLAETLRGGRYQEGKLFFGDDNPEDIAPLSPAIQH